MRKINIQNCPANLNGIYKIDFPNNKSYIGKAVDIKRRMQEHNTDKRQPVLYAAIQKYFQGKIEEFIILEENVPREQLSEKEKYYIALYKSNDKKYGYNLTSGGDGAELGIKNVASKFTQNDLNDIIELLQKTEIPMCQIAEKYNCNRLTIGKINAGETYFNSELNYPLRKQKYITKSGYLNANSSLDEKQLNNLIDDLKELKMSFKEIENKYNISSSTLTNINRGITYHNNSIDYPIRKKNAIRKRIFTQEEMSLIKGLLENKKESMENIALKIGCDRKVISDINQGKRQFQERWHYPIR